MNRKELFALTSKFLASVREATYEDIQQIAENGPVLHDERVIEHRIDQVGGTGIFLVDPSLRKQLWAELRCECSGLRNDPMEFVSAINHQLIERYVKPSRELTFSKFQSLLSKAAKYVENHWREKSVYFFPCSLPLQCGITEAVGAVTFLNGKDFFPTIENFLKDQGVDEKAFEKHKENFSAPDISIATVEVEACSAANQIKIAQQAVGAAISVLRLFMAPRDAKRIHAIDLSSSPITPLLSGTKSNGEILSIKFGGSRYSLPVEYMADYFTLLRTNTQVSSGASSAIDEILDLENSIALRECWLDALHWYSDAVVESRSTSIIVKCVCCWERLTPFVSNQTYYVPRTMDLFLRQLKRYEGIDTIPYLTMIYDARSRIVHGDTALLFDDAHLDTTQVLDVTRHILIGALPVYARMSMDDGTIKDLKKWVSGQLGVPPGGENTCVTMVIDLVRRIAGRFRRIF